VTETCPRCKGTKVIRGYACPGFRLVEMPCIDCGGTGEVDDVRRLWREHGATLKVFRTSRDMSLGEASRWIGVRPSEWSDAEHGRTDPGELLGRVQQKAIGDIRGKARL